MGIIRYKITGGELPVTASLIGSGLADNIHNIYEEGSFTVGVGTYTLSFVDSLGCTENVSINPCLTCPDGFYPVGAGCELVETEPATEYLPLETLIARGAIEYTSKGTLIFDTWQQDGTGTFEKINTSNLYWINQNPNTSSNGPMNRSGVWVGNTRNQQTIRFSECINIPETKTYYIGVGCDNKSRVWLNGTLIIDQDLVAIAAMLGITTNIDRPPFNYWFIYPIEIPAGRNILEGEGYNVSSIAGLGVEIYNASKEDLKNATSDGDLGEKLIFRAKDFVGQSSSYEYSPSGGLHGYVCPPGFVLVTCDGDEYCQKKSFVECGQFIAETPEWITEDSPDCSIAVFPYISDTSLTKSTIVTQFFEPDRLVSEFNKIEITRIVLDDNALAQYNGQDLYVGEFITFAESPHIRFWILNYLEIDTVSEIWFKIYLIGEMYPTQEVHYKFTSRACEVGSVPTALHVSLDTVLNGDYNYSIELPITYNPGVEVTFQNPVTAPGEYHYMFVSLPTGRSFTIKDALNNDITSLFLFYSEDNRTGYVNNSIYRYTQPFGTGGPVDFKLTLV